MLRIRHGVREIMNMVRLVFVEILSGFIRKIKIVAAVGKLELRSYEKIIFFVLFRNIIIFFILRKNYFFLIFRNIIIIFILVYLVFNLFEVKFEIILTFL